MLAFIKSKPVNSLYNGINAFPYYLHWFTLISEAVWNMLLVTDNKM